MSTSSMPMAEVSAARREPLRPRRVAPWQVGGFVNGVAADVSASGVLAVAPGGEP